MEYIVPSITFLIGLATAFVILHYQSKEVLKQILYKEKLSNYKELIAKALELTILIDVYSRNLKENEEKLNHAALAFATFLFTIMHLVPTNLGKVCAEYIAGVLAAKCPEEFEALSNSYPFNKIADIIRDDLGIDKLSEGLVDLYSKFPVGSLLKSKNKT